MNRKGRGSLAFCLSASFALWSPSVYAETTWWILNAGTAKCDDARTSQYASPAALRAALMKNNMLKDMQVFRDKDNNVKGVMFVANQQLIFTTLSRGTCVSKPEKAA